jgi:MFS family permease
MDQVTVKAALATSAAIATHPQPVGGYPVNANSAQPATKLLATGLQPTAEHRPALTKTEIRTSLGASTLDGMLATVFATITSGVLINSFLVQLGASALEIGILAALPMLANFVQPIGAVLADRSDSRHCYCFWVYGISRSLWLLLAGAIAYASFTPVPPHQLVTWTLAIAAITYFVGALGSAAWLSWLAVLVPRRLRGRYFGLRNSAANLVALVGLPLAGAGVSLYPGGPIGGYGLALVVAVAAGLISLLFQNWMVDVNPQIESVPPLRDGPETAAPAIAAPSIANRAIPTISPTFDWPRLDLAEIWQNSNFLGFLLYFTTWTFAVSLSAPFFNIYLLDTLGLDVGTVTLYNSLTAGANLAMMLVWGRCADRWGNRPLLVGVGLAVALLPLGWLATGSGPLSLWLGLPLLHILLGGTWAAIDLCTNNLQLEIAPPPHQAKFLATAAALAGVSGALGTICGGALAQFAESGGFLGLFALSSAARLLALLPLILKVRESDRVGVTGWRWLGGS